MADERIAPAGVDLYALRAIRAIFQRFEMLFHFFFGDFAVFNRCVLHAAIVFEFFNLAVQ